MKSVIVGTAGHIDHGKTALVKALTGIDADRLQEEKRRGVTIDIGFAHLNLPGSNGETLELGFVDVPGHERFVRNMLAGIGGIDLVLFVIAADESIKPQTREHFDICRLLSIPRGITVLTKSDTVDAETLSVVRREVEEFVRGSFLDASHSPIVSVSALTGAGIEQLKKHLAALAAQSNPRDSSALARLPIDRVFTMKGFGTVVTGTLVSGTIHKEDELEVFPHGTRARVRGVQVHGKTTEQATAGERTALNLAGVNKEELGRGMVLAPPATFQSTSRVDVTLSLLPTAKAVKDRSRVHLHAYTSETIAEIVLHEGKLLSPGETAFAQIRLAAPTLLLPGDRFIIRQFSPVVTIGGGVVLDAAPLPKAKKENLRSSLTVLRTGTTQTILKLRIARRTHQGLSLSQAVAETGWRKEFIEKQLAGPLASAYTVRSSEMFFHPASVEGIKLHLADAIADFHNRNPLSPGTNTKTLRDNLPVHDALFAIAIAALVQEKKIEVKGEIVHLPGRGVVMKDEEAEAKKTIENAFASTGLKVPALKDVLAGLKLDKARATKIITLLLREKALIKISDDLVFHRSALDNLRKLLISEKTKSPKFDVARFKDLTGVSRKYAIPLLEYLDRERVTRREGDDRIIL